MVYSHSIDGGWRIDTTASDVGLEPEKLLIIILAVLIFFVAAVLCSKRDSIIRCLAYSFILTLLAVYLIFVFLIPNIRDWHPLIPANCLISGDPQLVAYRTSRGAVHYAHVPVNVSHILCAGTAAGEGQSNDSPHRVSHWSNDKASPGQLDYREWDMCSVGASIVNGSTGYIRLDGWYEFDPDERNDALNRYHMGANYFCWVDPQNPEYVTFYKDQDWAGIFYPIACLALIIFLCWSAGTFALIGSCCKCAAISSGDGDSPWGDFDPWFLRIDAKTPAKRLRQMRGGVDLV